MFFRNYSTYEGEPARLYRSPEEISRDILAIRTSIDLVNSQLNARNVLASLMDEMSYGEPEKWIPAVASIVVEAEEALERLQHLKDVLDALSQELEDTKWALGI